MTGNEGVSGDGGRVAGDDDRPHQRCIPAPMKGTDWVSSEGMTSWTGGDDGEEGMLGRASGGEATAKRQSQR